MKVNSDLNSDLRAAILNPLCGWRHEFVPMPEWGGQLVAVREPSLEDRAFWLDQLTAEAGVEPGDSEDAVRQKYRKVRAEAHRSAFARLFVRVLHVDTPCGWRRMFVDEDADLVASAYGAAHDRIVNKALDLGKLNVDPVDDGKNSSAEIQASDSN
ncbi:phage tail assembly chaperone [Burkholderia ubonensis]|uniref:phage tail assembly chaperone n=1 Tax=Burkholderia ubonensis TaxID=101571 RepID=UPI00075A3517|nr:phage tail assembly chaperone [Burkholderia ubonensis]KVL10760.1 phage tail protein [Burkholderia ubonensis]KVL66582.1 phage tail protein [Burkholderia ubonensis]KVL68344.1 phage tail protein [Burkholderia ubonensis]KVL96831.1 phage tail protein [Burkholderia ubonensis]KVO88535.1 phage tail protein [Burkholderia ubonensis]